MEKHNPAKFRSKKIVVGAIKYSSSITTYALWASEQVLTTISLVPPDHLTCIHLRMPEVLPDHLRKHF